MFNSYYYYIKENPSLESTKFKYILINDFTEGSIFIPKGFMFNYLIFWKESLIYEWLYCSHRTLKGIIEKNEADKYISFLLFPYKTYNMWNNYRKDFLQGIRYNQII